MSKVYYNEIDPYCCAWLRNLIAEGLIADGDVDERSIKDVQADDLEGYTQCHFFAGIGGWSLALRLAGWPDERPVWTGSCPCQPFSAAGKQQGEKDERHLWPEFRRLIAERKPSTVFGEQVASRLGRDWLSVVRLQMEALGYAVGAADLCAAGIGAPHIRQRLWFVGVANSTRSAAGSETSEAMGYRCAVVSTGGNGELADAERDPRDAGRLAIESGEGVGAPQAGPSTEPGRCGLSRPVADADGGYPGAEGLQRGGEHGCEPQGGGVESVEHTLPAGRPEGRPEPGNGSATGGCVPVSLGDTAIKGRQGCEDGAGALPAQQPPAQRTSGDANPWSDCIWLPCTDGKQRPTQPGIFPLAHGVPARVAKLRAAGNAIVPQVAAEFIKACL